MKNLLQTGIISRIQKVQVHGGGTFGLYLLILLMALICHDVQDVSLAEDTNLWVIYF